MAVNILGISAFHHDSACCLLQDGKLIAAVEEEPFTRIKHDPPLPINAFLYCLKKGNISIADIDRIAFYETPEKVEPSTLGDSSRYTFHKPGKCQSL